MWRMYAHDLNGKPHHVCAKETMVALYGPGEVRAVDVTETEDNPTHWGWLDTKKPDGPPHMVWPSRGQIEMCFPYGMNAEIERGGGRMVELTIVFAESPDGTVDSLLVNGDG